MDFKNYKKISDEKETAILRHDKGHLLTIAKKGLTPKLLIIIDKMPIHKAEGGYTNSSNQSAVLKENYTKRKKKLNHYADGGSVNNDTNTSTDTTKDTSTSNSNTQDQYVDPDTGLPTTLSNPYNQPTSTTPDSTTDNTSNAQQNSPINNNTQQTPPIDNNFNPYLPTSTTSNNLPPAPISQIIAENHQNEQMNWNDDLYKGHITPETYSGLFHNKSTLGKIGTLFGLALSGAGSGLAHQQNAALDMMNNEINRDLNAQVTSASNAQNFYKLALAHQFQNAQMHQMDINNALTQAQTANVPLQGKLTEAQTIAAQKGAGLTEMQTQNAYLEAQANAMSLAKSKMVSAAYYQQLANINAMPEGPLKQQAQQSLGQMYPMIAAPAQTDIKLPDGKIYSKEQQQLDSVTNYMKLISGNTSVPLSGAVNYNKMQMLARMGQNKMPNGMTTEDVSNATKEAADLEQSRSMRAEYGDNFNKLNAMIGAGTLHPAQRDAYVNAMSAKIAKQSAGRYNLQEATQIVNGMFPSMGDAPETDRIKAIKGQQYFDNIDSATPTLNRFGLKNAIQNTTQSNNQQNMNIPEGTTGSKIINGKNTPVIYQQGAWRLKQ